VTPLFNFSETQLKEIKTEYSATPVSSVKGRRKPVPKIKTEGKRQCNFCKVLCLSWKDFVAHTEGKHREKLIQRRKLKVFGTSSSIVYIFHTCPYLEGTNYGPQ
jgi:hypothetical protein